VVSALSRGTSGRSIGNRANIDTHPIEKATNVIYKFKVADRMRSCGLNGHTAKLLGTV
jgi:metal-dependent amidase/aminoacylase/carboxypeptidase family protein